MSHEFGRQIGHRIKDLARNASLGAIIVSGATISSSPSHAQENPQPNNSFGVFPELQGAELRRVGELNTPNTIPFRSIHSTSDGFKDSLLFLGSENSYQLSQFLQRSGYEPNDNPAPVIDLNREVVLAIGERQLTDKRVTDSDVNNSSDRIVRVESVALDNEGSLRVKTIEYGAEICEDQLSVEDPEGDKKYIDEAFKPLTPGELVVATLPEGITPNAIKNVFITREQYGVDTNGCIVTTVAFSSVTIGDGGNGNVLNRSYSVDAIVRP